MENKERLDRLGLVILECADAGNSNFVIERVSVPPIPVVNPVAGVAFDVRAKSIKPALTNRTELVADYGLGSDVKVGFELFAKVI